MRLFYATASGEPAPRDGHDVVQWLTASELDDVVWLESDRGVLVHLHLEGQR